MRRPALIFLLAGVALGGCADFCGAMLGLDECEDECELSGDRVCDGDQVVECRLDWWWSSCTYWNDAEDCADRGAVCVDGSCYCPPRLVDCGVCVDLLTDGFHCGGCGQACGVGTCQAGACQCTWEIPTVTRCGGFPACVDTATDPAHCGGCFLACPLAGDLCVAGACVCPVGTTPCVAQGTCADLSNDPNNCGNCGVRCQWACLGGGCFPS